MHQDEDFPEMPLLEELKERGRNAIAESRAVLREMRGLAADLRREQLMKLRRDRRGDI